MKFLGLLFTAVLTIPVAAENNNGFQNNQHGLVHLRLKEVVGKSSTGSSSCCKISYFTYTGEGTLYFPPAPSTSLEAAPQPSQEISAIMPISPTITCPSQAVITVTKTIYICSSSSHSEPTRTNTVITHPSIHNPKPSSTSTESHTLAHPSSTSTDCPDLVPTLSTSIDILIPTYVNPSPSISWPISSNPGRSGSDDKIWAITFSLFNDDRSCKTSATIWTDINLIRLAGFKAIRIYGTECSALEMISPAASFHGLKMIVGIFISETGISDATQQVTHVVKWGRWDLVDLIVIGNEALFNKHISPKELVEFINTSKLAFRSAGYNGPCTTAEPLNILQENSGILCDAVDVVGCNIHPFFNPEVDASHAGQFVKSQLHIVESICPGKHGINLECGWPSAGECNGKACPGKKEQEKAIEGIQSYVGNVSVMFTFSNDYWKDPGSFHVEQNFGLIKLLTRR